MKKIILGAIVTPNDDSVTQKNLKDALRHLGSTYFAFAAEVRVSEVEGMTKEVWIYLPDDNSLPYIQVEETGKTEGKHLSEQEVDQLRTSGVCIEFRAEYPRANRYGVPWYACDDEFAAGVVGNHLFKVDSDGLTVHAIDRGDDGLEQIWLKIVLPE